MRTISFLLLWCLGMTWSLQTFAVPTSGSSEKSEGTSIELLLVNPTNDGPAQDGKDPITPNQFVVKLDNRVLTITTTLEETVTCQLKNQTTNDSNSLRLTSIPLFFSLLVLCSYNLSATYNLSFVVP